MEKTDMKGGVNSQIKVGYCCKVKEEAGNAIYSLPVTSSTGCSVVRERIFISNES